MSLRSDNLEVRVVALVHMKFNTKVFISPATNTVSCRLTALRINSKARHAFPDPGGPQISSIYSDRKPASDGGVRLVRSLGIGVPDESMELSLRHGVEYVRGLASKAEAEVESGRVDVELMGR